MTVRTPIEVGSRAIPGWAIGLTVLVFLVGGVYLAGNLGGENPPILGAPSGSAGASGGGNVAQQGKQIIENKAQPACTACHGADLTGGVGPSLHGVANGPVSENLQELGQSNPDDWAQLWIDGTDPAVADLDRGGMPAFGEQLTPEEIDSIVEYLKTLQ
ncbi:MAG TPA: cytochrome c [Candidatus Limnocylindria bacterium]|jgi:mono/diheme cytochrome c family protein|nr:cytochrome c [Candidatus Limnocylindria bacterium]